MKKMLILFLTLSCIAAFSQKKRKLPTVTSGRSMISKNDVLIDSFKLKNKKFKIYRSYEEPSSYLSQNKGDTFEVYKIFSNSYSIYYPEIHKYATRNGKIIREATYKIENDTLVIESFDYDLFSCSQIIEKYGVDKYGLKELSKEFRSLDCYNLSDKYLKPQPVNVPPPPIMGYPNPKPNKND